MREWDWEMIGGTILLALVVFAAIVGVFYFVRAESLATRLCMDAGYTSATFYTNGDVYCHGIVKGSSVTVLMKRGGRGQ